MGATIFQAIAVKELISGNSKIGKDANSTLGFYGATPTAQLTGVAVSAAGIHAALVTLGLITA